MRKIKISCEEAATICTKTQYGESSLLDRIKLSLHLVYCKVCRLYSKQNTQLTDICSLAKKQEELKNKTVALSDDFKNQLQENIKKSLE